MVRDVIRLSQDFFWLFWHDSLLSYVDLGVSLPSTPFAKHELAVFAIKLSLGGSKWLVLLWQRFEVLFLFLRLFLFTLLLGFLALLRFQGRVVRCIKFFGFFLDLLLFSLIVCSFFVGFFGFLISSFFRTINLFLSGS